MQQAKTFNCKACGNELKFVGKTIVNSSQSGYLLAKLTALGYEMGDMASNYDCEACGARFYRKELV